MDTSDLFFHAGPGHAFYIGAAKTHPADLMAILRTADAVGFYRLYLEGRIRLEEAIPTDLRGTKILFGGPTSQVLARIMYEYEEEGDTLRRRPDAALTLPFVGLTDADETHRKPPLMPGGQLALRPVWGFVDWEGETHLQETQRDGKLEKDLLVVTRMRNFLPDDWEEKESYFIHVTGASDVGAGTAAVQSLLYDEDLASRLEALAGPEFSALFEVYDIPYRDNEAGVGKISVKKLTQLGFGRSTYAEAHRRAATRLGAGQPRMGPDATEE